MILTCPHCQREVDCTGLAGTVTCAICRQLFTVPAAPPSVRTVAAVSANPALVPDQFQFSTVSKTPARVVRKKSRSKGLIIVVVAALALVLVASLAGVLFWPSPRPEKEHAAKPAKGIPAKLPGDMNTPKKPPRLAPKDGVNPSPSSPKVPRLIVDQPVADANPDLEFFSPEDQQVTYTSTGSDFEMAINSLGFRRKGTNETLFIVRGAEGNQLRFRTPFNETERLIWVEQRYEVLDHKDRVIFASP